MPFLLNYPYPDAWFTSKKFKICSTGTYYTLVMNDITIPENLRCWSDKLGCAVTICDANAKIIYMNERSRQTFSPDSDIIGNDLLQYHPEHAKKKILEMLASDSTNAYTIRKNGQKKLIYQTPWHQNGKVAGLVELSIPLPDEMPHYER